MADRSRMPRGRGAGVLAFLLLVVSLAGCVDQRLAFPTSILAPIPPIKAETAEPETIVSTRGRIDVSSVPRRPQTQVSRLQVEPSTIRLGSETVSGTFDQMPLNAFINTVFGDILKVSYQLDPGLGQRTDMVTLRAEPQPPARFLELIRQVLVNYGIVVTERAGTLLIIPNALLSQQAPAILRSRSQADVPVGLRPVFQYVDLMHVRPQTITTVLGEAFGGRLKVSPTPAGNAVLLMGLPDDVRAALATIQLFDQPVLANRASIRLKPAYWTVERLASKLTEILRTEGYDVSNRIEAAGLIQMIPVETVNALIVFAADQATLDHVLDWATELDQPSQVIGNNTIFYYAVRNTKAENIAPLLAIIDQGVAPAPATTTGGAPGVPGAPGAAAGAPGSPAASAGMPGASSGTASRAPSAAQRVVVDPARNAIIFKGSAEEFSQIRGLLESLDQPVREALIEVTVAEIRLSDTTNLGVEWTIQNAGIDSSRLRFGTLGGLGVGTSGFNFAVLNDAAQTRAVVNAFAKDERFSILSSPRLLAKSGSEARIQVGTEVPILTSQQTTSSTIAGNPAVLQSIQYRSTGVLLTVKPVIHAGDRVDLEVSQEVSEATTNSTSAISSPVISNRKISTNLTLRDGATVILGGLISENRDASNTGIPFLKDLPGIGQLFSAKGTANRKTELIVLITPYIIDSDEQAKAVTDAFRQRFPTVPR